VKYKIDAFGDHGAEIGLNSTTAITMFYSQIKLRQGLPFDARIPNVETRDAIKDARAGKKLKKYASAKVRVCQFYSKACGFSFWHIKYSEYSIAWTKKGFIKAFGKDRKSIKKGCYLC
jgi:addiction module RelB/DinJ family antitoxin